MKNHRVEDNILGYKQKGEMCNVEKTNSEK